MQGGRSRRGAQWAGYQESDHDAYLERLRTKRGKREYVGPDHCTASGAANLAARIIAYWREQTDKTILCSIETIAGPGSASIYCVRSNIRSVLF